MTPEPVVAGYHSLVAIGRGGLGDVYRATRASTGETVAIKILRDVSDSSVAWHRTRRELAALVAFEGHANVVRPVELIELADGPALVMEYACGGCVAELMAERGEPLSVDEVVFVGTETSRALVVAHGLGIVHRDIKPQNLLIDAAGGIKLCDFGIAALTDDDEYRTRTNAVSTRYASPEDLEQDQPVGPPADIYSLGATLLHLARGTSLTLKDRLCAWVPPAADDRRLAALDRVIARCLDPDPSVRPSALQLTASLEALAADPAGEPVRALVGHRCSPAVPASDAPGSVPSILLADVHEVDREALTVHRGAPAPHAAVPERPPPMPWWRRLVVAGIVLAALAVVGVLAVIAFRPNGSEHSDTPDAVARSTSVTTTPGLVAASRPVGLPPLVGADWSAGDVGDCLTQVDSTQTLAITDCDQPHDLQRFAAGDVSAMFPPSSEFTEGSLEVAVTAACDDAFARFVGGSVTTSELDTAHTRPTAQTWAGGDRGYQCLLGVEGQRLAGDARTSGW